MSKTFQNRIARSVFNQKTIGYFCFCAFVLLFGTTKAKTQTQPNTAEPVQIEVGKDYERDLAGGQSHLYKISVKANQYIHLEALQKGIDVKLIITAPNGATLRELDTPNGKDGTEFFFAIMETAGEYRIEITPLEANAKAGKYRLKVDELRDANADDPTRINAEKLLRDAQTLFYYQGSAENRKDGMAKIEEALNIFKQINDTKGLAISYLHTGRFFYILAERDKAVEYMSASIPYWQELGDKGVMVSAYNLMGQMRFSQYRMRQAIDFFARSAVLAHELGVAKSEMNNLVSIAGAYQGLRENAKALETFAQVRELNRTAKLDDIEATCLLGIGKLLQDYGEYEKAKEYFLEGLNLSRKVKDRFLEAHSLERLGTTARLQGENQKAFEYLNQELAIWSNPLLKDGVAGVKTRMGSFYLFTGETDRAIEILKEAKNLYSEINNPRKEATAKLGLALALYKKGDLIQALNINNECLATFIEYEDKFNESVANINIAVIERDLGNLSAALMRTNKTLAFLEAQRQEFTNQELRASYSSTIQKHYEFKIDLLMQLYKQGNADGVDYSAQALQTFESSRARSLLEMLTEANANIRQGVDAQLLAREETINQDIAAKSKLLVQLLSSGKKENERKNTLTKELENLRSEYQQVLAQIRSTSPRYAALTQPVPLSVKEIQNQVLDSDTALLEYALGEKRSFAWVVTKDSLQSFELPARKEIESKAQSIYKLLTVRNKRVKFETVEEKQARITKADEDLTTATNELSQVILAPVAKSLTKKRLLVVSSGALQYIPFAVLQKSESSLPLVAEHDIINLPSASTLAVLRKEIQERKPAPKSIAIFADPVFNAEDERVKTAIAKDNKKAEMVATVTKTRGIETNTTEEDNFSDLSRTVREMGGTDSGFTMSRLPFTRQEANAITALVPAAQNKIAMDFSASRSEALNSQLSQYRIVHFATHSFVSNAHPELSGIVLSLYDEKGKSQDGFLRTSDIYNLKLPADLIVLSGCKTGLGKEIKGEGLVGLTRGFMYAGAARVAVSLWDVNDEATSELMTRFYRGMLKEKLSPSEALRQAQISMMQDKRWTSPYYWASFVLQGEPR